MLNDVLSDGEILIKSGEQNRTHLIDPNKLIRTKVNMMIPKGKKKKCFNYTNAVQFSLRFFDKAAAIKKYFKLSSEARNKTAYGEDLLVEADSSTWARGNIITMIESKIGEADFQCQTDGGKLPVTKNAKDLAEIANMAKSQGITFQPLNLDQRGSDLVDPTGRIRVDSMSTTAATSMEDVPGIDVDNKKIILKPAAEAGTLQKILCLIPRANLRESIVHHTHFTERWDIMYKILGDLAQLGAKLDEAYKNLKATTHTGPCLDLELRPALINTYEKCMIPKDINQSWNDFYSCVNQLQHAYAMYESFLKALQGEEMDITFGSRELRKIQVQDKNTLKAIDFDYEKVPGQLTYISGIPEYSLPFVALLQNGSCLGMDYEPYCDLTKCYLNAFEKLDDYETCCQDVLWERDSISCPRAIYEEELDDFQRQVFIYGGLGSGVLTVTSLSIFLIILTRCTKFGCKIYKRKGKKSKRKRQHFTLGEVPLHFWQRGIVSDQTRGTITAYPS